MFIFTVTFTKLNVYPHADKVLHTSLSKTLHVYFFIEDSGVKAILLISLIDFGLVEMLFN